MKSSMKPKTNNNFNWGGTTMDKKVNAAVGVIDSACASLICTRKDHVVMQEAIKIITDALAVLDENEKLKEHEE